jgi:hypothetical protein
VTALDVETSSEEYASAETMLIDEAGVELLIDGEIQLGGSFENLDNFELAYRVLPEDFELDEQAGFNVLLEKEISGDWSEEALEMAIWIHSQELAERRGYKK